MALTRRGEVDAVVVGSGPGGATVARHLAQAHKRVILLERGRDHREKPYYGTHLGALIYADRGGLLFTEEGLNIVRPLMTGGATNMFTGSAARPPQWLKENAQYESLCNPPDKLLDIVEQPPLQKRLWSHVEHGSPRSLCLTCLA